MAGKNDILATAGVDLSAFEAGIAKLTSRLDAVEKSGSKAASGIEKVDKTANKLKNIQTAQAFSSALLGIANNAGVAASAVSELNASSGIGGSSPLLKTFSAISDAAANIPGPVGIIASGVSAATAQIAQSFTVLNKYQGLARKDGISTKSAIEKEVALQKEFIDAQNTAFAAAHHLFGAQTQNEEALANMRASNSSQFEVQSKKEVALIKDKTAGAAQRLSLMQVEQERQQNISDLNAELQNQFSGGVMDKDALKVRDAALNKINAEAEAKKKILSVSEAQEKSEVSLNQSASVRGVTMSDAIEAQTSYQTELNAQLKIAQGLFAANSVQVTSLEKALHESALAVDAINFAQEQNLTSAKGNNEALEKTITGDKSAVASAKEKAAYEIARNQAIKDGNDDLLGQVDIQHDLSTKQIGIDEKNEQTQKSLLRKKQQIGITQQDHLKDLDAELYAAQESLRISNDAGQQGTVINEQLKEAAHQKAKALVLGQLALKDQERQANLEKDAAVQQQAGNQKLTTLAQIRAQYEVQITQAIREGRIEVAKQLTAQKQIAELEAKIADFQKTPQQRQDELKEQQKHDQAQGTVISRQQDREARARELGGINAKEKKSLEDLKHGQTIGKSAKEIRDMAKEQGVSEKPMTPEEIDRTLGRSDSTNRTSKSREKQLGNFLEERAPAPADIAKIQKQDVGQMDVQKINLAMLQNAP